MERLRDILSQVEWNSLLIVLLFGMAGGLCYWFYMLYDAQLSGLVRRDFLLNWLAVLPSVLILGGFTALVGVYYITGNQPAETTKAVVLALVFGFSFNSVLQYLSESQTRLMNLEQAEVNSAELIEENTRLKERLTKIELRNAGVNERASEIKVVKKAQAEQIISALRTSSTRSARLRYFDQARRLIGEIETSAAGSVDPTPAIRDLGELSASAVAADQDLALAGIDAVTNIAAARLEDLPAQPGPRAVQEALLVYRAADQALQDVARAARLQTQASIISGANNARFELARLVSLRYDALDAPDQDAFRLRLENLRAAATADERKMQIDGLLIPQERQTRLSPRATATNS